MAATKVKTLAEQKRDLIARSDLYRQAMSGDLQRLNAGIGWLPKTFSLIKAASPLLIMASPLAAWLLRGRHKTKPLKDNEPPKGKAGAFARIWGMIKIAQQVVPFVHGFMKAWPATNGSQPRKREPVQPSRQPRS